MRARVRMPAGSALGLGLTMIAAQPALADSTCVTGTPVTTAPVGTAADCTNPNGNGHTEVTADAGVVTMSLVNATAVVRFSGNGDSGLTTGYIESNTAGRGVLRITTDQAFTYTGTGSTLVGQATATGADTLNIVAPSVTLTTGTLTALGEGSTALDVSSNGGAGSGGIDATVDGDILSAGGAGIILDQNNAAATGSIVLTSTAGNTITSGAGNAVTIDAAGSGTITVNLADGVSATGGDGIEVRDSTTGGDISVTTAAVTSTDAGDDAIDVQSSSTGADITVVTNGAIDAGDDGIIASLLDATATGNINVTTNSTVDAGNNGIETMTAGTGTITVNSAGAITAVDDGITATSAGGAITITASGDVASTTEEGIDAFQTDAAGTGEISVTASGDVTGFSRGIRVQNLGSGPVTVDASGNVTGTAGDGILVIATTGTVDVNVTGGADITGTNGEGIDIDADGAKTITIGAGSVVTGTNAIETGGLGATIITNAGALTGTGGATILADALADGAVTVNNSTGGVINGSVNLTDANDTINNAGTWNISGGNFFYAGTDVITNQAGGVLNVATATTISGLETLSNAGTINAASGITFDLGNTVLTNTGTLNLAGALDLGAGTDTFANTGTGVVNLTAASSIVGAETFTQTGRINLNTFTLTGAGTFNNAGFIDTSGSAGLAGFTSFSNSGTLDLAAGTFTVPAALFTNGGTILADEGATTITGQTSFANSGNIDLQNGATSDVLTINSAFIGSGGSNLLIDVDQTTADRLVINGAASGTTTVNVSPVGGIFINPDGVLVVDTVSTTAGAFVLGTADVGLIDLDLVQIGQDFFLTALPDIAAIEPVVIGSLAQGLWYQSADIYRNYAVLRRTDLAGSGGFGAWGQAYWSRDRSHGDRDVTVFDTDFVIDRVRTKRRGIQAGVDYLFGNAAVGITGGYERADADIRHSDSDFDAKGFNIGAYAMFGGSSGFYGDLLVKYDKADLEFDNPLFVDMTGDPDIKSFGVQGQVGYRFVSGSMNFDLGAGLAHVKSKIDDFAVDTIEFDFDSVRSTRGHLSARAGFGNGPWSPFVEATLFHEFKDDSDLELVSGTAVDVVEGEGRGTWGRLEAGIGAQNGSGPILAAWADFGDVRGFGVKAGFRFGGRREAAPPPPPPSPPPPPPPPATQTCPDGSVILATETCPPPPSPPAPPPPEPEPERG